jgi:hypothetical protein
MAGDGWIGLINMNPVINKKMIACLLAFVLAASGIFLAPGVSASGLDPADMTSPADMANMVGGGRQCQSSIYNQAACGNGHLC